MTLDDVKSLREMFDNHMTMPADQMAELFDFAEATLTPAPKASKTKATEAAPAPAETPAPADTVVAQG